ncbi:hypothetical protein [Natronobacterium texcoconense]|uniref:Uncharacterized protein n=1 Tax=Natronobacterium texcoconense TaxID=1095778 RepID=A0A1H1H3H6_NATTX|nr:hypothetical protein [Natronobacterium texcoconense]SDR19990.1 hypothetical protein SAMN04489842_2773 [Natronobacterium texcoconense]
MSSRTTAARGIVVLTVVGLVGVLLYYLPQPGYGPFRLVLFGLIAGAAVLGGIGVVRRRPAFTIGGIVGLFLLGFWQAVLSVFIFPAIGLFLLALLLDYDAYDRTARPR